MKISIWTLVVLVLVVGAVIMATSTRKNESVNTGNEVGLYLVEYKFDNGIRCYVVSQKSVSCLQVNGLAAAKGE